MARKRSSSTYKEIETLEQFNNLTAHKTIRHYAFQGIDFKNADIAEGTRFEDCIFLGCNIPEIMSPMISCCSMIFPNLKVPYNIFPNHLYSPEELFKGYDPQKPESYCQCYDQKVFCHFTRTGKKPDDIRETLARSLHDHSMRDALYDFLSTRDERHVVGIMGGHGLLRTDEMYQNVAHISKALTEKGVLMISGGGPGAMEATHLGAWMAGYPNEALEQALDILKASPSFRDKGWMESAMDIKGKFPNKGYSSLGLPTWLYGHEPSTCFATHIAKFFDNSIREDEIVTIAKGGLVFAPGSAGTVQEIFQDAVQNHYLSFGYASPMLFLGREFWTKDMMIYPLLKRLQETDRYRNLLLSITDDTEEATDTIMNFIEEGDHE